MCAKNAENGLSDGETVGRKRRKEKKEKTTKKTTPTTRTVMENENGGWKKIEMC